jgi:hypothetical protein
LRGVGKNERVLVPRREREPAHALGEGKRDVKILYGLRFFSKCMGVPV